jgi:hypothetical protein
LGPILINVFKFGLNQLRPHEIIISVSLSNHLSNQKAFVSEWKWCSKERRKSSTSSTGSAAGAGGSRAASADARLDAPASVTTVTSDDPEFDLKCKEKVSDSETDQESESETIFSQNQKSVSAVEIVEAQLNRLSRDDLEGSNFVLGPTPAQQKRHEDEEDVLENDRFRSKLSTLPEFHPGGAQTKLPSLPTSPQLFIQSYRKKRGGVNVVMHSVDNLGSDAETPNKSGTPSNGFCDSTPKSTGSTPSSTLSGQRFFGPDFNPDNFNVGRDDGGEMSPFCSEGNSAKSGPSNLRRTLDHRRQLVKYNHFCN